MHSLYTHKDSIENEKKADIFWCDFADLDCRLKSTAVAEYCKGSLILESFFTLAQISEEGAKSRPWASSFYLGG